MIRKLGIITVILARDIKGEFRFGDFLAFSKITKLLFKKYIALSDFILFYLIK